jgi:hypothetical protein
MSTLAPVFVVGVSRSGTTLVASMLGAHSRLYCGPETFFFPRLERQRLDVLLAADRWPEAALAFLTDMALGKGPARIHELFGRTADDLRADLAASRPSVRALLEALTAAGARAAGKARWVEKTPNHLLYLPVIREHYPDAFIVRVVRDPRDVATSLTRVPFGSPSKLANLYLWLERDARSWPFFETDRRCLTLRYEDLLADPAVSLERVCQWIGEPFEAAMLEPSRASAQMMANEEWWKRQVLAPLDRSRTAEWRHTFSESELRVADLVCREALERYGYPHSGTAVRYCFVKPLTRRAIERQEEVAIRAAERGVALLPWSWDRTDHREVPPADGLAALWGVPGRVTFRLGRTARERLVNAARLLRGLASRRWGRQPVYWLAVPGDDGEAPGWLDRVCGALARVLAPAVSADQLFEMPVRRAVAAASPPAAIAHNDDASTSSRRV